MSIMGMEGDCCR